jgi:hypothetical protein
MEQVRVVDADAPSRPNDLPYARRLTLLNEYPPQPARGDAQSPPSPSETHRSVQSDSTDETSVRPFHSHTHTRQHSHQGQDPTIFGTNGGYESEESYVSASEQSSNVDSADSSDDYQFATILQRLPIPRGPRKLRIVILTVGSRGDVQYIIPFCARLHKMGHHCTIATHEPFRKMVTEHGLRFAPVAGDPNEIIKECVENGLFSRKFLLKNGLGEGLRPWMDALFTTAVSAVTVGTDILIATPSAMVGYHIAEARDIRILFTHDFMVDY